MGLLSDKGSTSYGWKGDLDLFRVVAMFGVVWYHSNINFGHEVSYSSLVFFLAVSVYLSGNSKKSFREYIVDRFNRLILPWLFWFILFGVVSLLRGRPFLQVDGGALAAVLSGTSIHLWFLPYIFFVSIFFDFLRRIVNVNIVGSFTLFSLLILLAFVCEWRGTSLGFGYPWAQYFHGAAPVLLGFFLSLRIQWRLWAVWAVITSVLILSYLAIPAVGVGLPYLIGFSMFLVIHFGLFRFESPRWLAFLGSLMFGVYLVHPLFLDTFDFYIDEKMIALPLLAFSSSLLFVVLTVRFCWLAWPIMGMKATSSR